MKSHLKLHKWQLVLLISTLILAIGLICWLFIRQGSTNSDNLDNPSNLDNINNTDETSANSSDDPNTPNGPSSPNNPDSSKDLNGPSSANPANPTTSKGYKIETIDGLTYIDGILIVNKSYPLPADYGSGITAEAQSAFDAMRQAAQAAGHNLTIVSGFRSYSTQNWLYENYAAKDGYAEADRYSARPGYSEHQSGLAMDLNWVDTDFAYTPAGQWLHHHAWEYGFVLRYPEGSEAIAGFIYEPWHFRYVGTDLASQLYNGGDWITLEEHFGIVSKYAE